MRQKIEGRIEVDKSLFFSSLIAFAFSFLMPGCSVAPPSELIEGYKVDFGEIEDDGELYFVANETRTITWDLDRSFPKIGARVENLSGQTYNLGFIAYFDVANDGELRSIEEGGYWSIKPPVNEDYEAFISLEEEPLPPGNYKFEIYVDERVLTTIDFSIKWSISSFGQMRQQVDALYKAHATEDE